jgi:two-component system, OmpR family, sensor histidine kinase CreC
MRLGVRLLFAFFVINGIAAFFILRVFTAEIKPSVREVMEDIMVDTAHILAELASDDLVAGRMQDGRFALRVKQYAKRPVEAKIWGVTKESLDFRVYATDAQGIVVFDSDNKAIGADYSQWRDVARTLKGQYGARATREDYADDKTAIMYVAAPIVHDQQIIGVLTVAKPISTIQNFIDRAERRVFVGGLWLLGLSAFVGVAVTLWMVWNIRRLRSYAQQVAAQGLRGEPIQVPQVPGELGELAQAMQTMRERLDGREYVEATVRALTHELKSPLAVIRASGELLEGELAPQDRTRFAAQITAQSDRAQHLVERMLELAKLEQSAARDARLHARTRVDLRTCLQAALDACQPAITTKNIAIHADSMRADATFSSEKHIIEADPEWVQLAMRNVLDNAVDFSPLGARIRISLRTEGAQHLLCIEDEAGGVPDYALPRLGERFFTTPRPDHAGGQRSGSGLGLAIAQQVMSLHGGALRFENIDSDGRKGLRVEMMFPTSP